MRSLIQIDDSGACCVVVKIIQDHRTMSCHQDLLMRLHQLVNHELDDFRIDAVLNFVEKQKTVVGSKFREYGYQTKHPVVDVPRLSSHRREKSWPCAFEGFANLNLLPTRAE